MKRAEIADWAAEAAAWNVRRCDDEDAPPDLLAESVQAAVLMLRSRGAEMPPEYAEASEYIPGPGAEPPAWVDLPAPPDAVASRALEALRFAALVRELRRLGLPGLADSALLAASEALLASRATVRAGTDDAEPDPGSIAALAESLSPSAATGERLRVGGAKSRAARGIPPRAEICREVAARIASGMSKGAARDEVADLLGISARSVADATRSAGVRGRPKAR